MSFKRCPVIWVFLGTMLLTACAQTPVQITQKYSEQGKMQAARHWSVLAADVARRIDKKIRHSVTPLRAVYVKPEKDTPFNTGFHEFLVTQLVNRGVNVFAEPDPVALEISYGTHVVYHREKRIERPYKGKYTLAAALLEAGVWVIRDAFVYGTEEAQRITLAGTALAAAAIGDLFSGAITKGLPHSEVIISTAIVDGNRYLHKTTDIYYVHDADRWHYEPPLAARTIPVVGE